MEVADDARQHGATWMELGLSIGLYSGRFGGDEATLRLLAAAAEAAEAATGVGIGFIVSAERHESAAKAEELAELHEAAGFSR